MSKMKIRVHEARKHLVWAGDNLDIDDGGDGVIVNPANGQTYYTLEAAHRIVSNVRGWHIPTKSEVNAFSKLDLPCYGKFNPYADKFEYVNVNGFYWTSTSNDDRYTWSLHATRDGIVSLSADDDNYYLSVRLVKD